MFKGLVQGGQTPQYRRLLKQELRRHATVLTQSLCLHRENPNEQFSLYFRPAGWTSSDRLQGRSIRKAKMEEC